jgi:hypothetical protein
MKIFIVIHCAWNTIESVWDSELQAQLAASLHANESNSPISNYSIIKRELNELKVPKDADNRV